MADIVFNTREVERALKAFNRDLQRRTRREMAAQARWGRDEIRAVWPRGPAEGGHSFRAVTSGTRGLRPYVRLNRNWMPRGSKPGWKSPIGWLVFGGTRKRDGRPWDKTPRPRLPDGRWFYPTIKRSRPRVVKEMRRILNDAIRQAGLD